jgi:hypothetical protein
MNDSIHKRWLAFSLFIVFILITLLMIVLPLFLNWLDSYEKKSELEFNLHRQQAILAIKDQKNHEPTYLNVLRFTDDDVMLIKNTIQRVEKYPNEETKKFTIELAHKTAEIIGLPETPQKKMEFLKTVLLDYVVLTR